MGMCPVTFHEWLQAEEEGIWSPCTGYSSNINNDNEQRADQGLGPPTGVPLLE